VVCGPSAVNVARVAAVVPGAASVVLGEQPVPACDALVFVAPCGVGEQRAGLLTLAQLVVHCVEAMPAVELTIVTGTALSAPDGSPVEPGAALYAGFAAVLQSEHPTLRVRLGRRRGRHIRCDHRADRGLRRGRRGPAGRAAVGGPA
jgi:hypothetical protein